MSLKRRRHAGGGRATAAALTMVMALAGASAWARQIDDPVLVALETAEEGGGVSVTLTFSRAADYRMLESDARLRLMLREPVDEASRVDRRLPSDILRRIRFDRTRRGTEIVFFLGRGFETFSLSELADPFRIVLTFRGSEATPAVPMVAPGETASDDREDPSMGWPEGAPALPRQPEGTRRPGEIRTIAIDPGHGGEEDGAVGSSGLKEKDLVLDLSQRLRDLLQRGGLSVILTRDSDQSLDLPLRTALANHMRADLFISIHANFSGRSAARGAETYFLSWDGEDEEADSLARREGGLPALPGGTPSERIDLVLWEMAQAEHLGRSSRLAEHIQGEMNALAGIPSRGVKQAPFRVLVGAAMPAVLVEVGFLSNAEEEALLAGSDYRDRVAAALAAAVERFRSESLREGLSTGGTFGGGGGEP